MGGSDVPANTTSTTTTDIPPEFKPYATQLLNRGVAASNTPYAPYPGARTTGFSINQNRAGTDIYNLGNQGRADAAVGREALLGAARGDYLDPASNPYLQSTYNQAARGLTDAYSTGTAAQTDAAAARAGALGGSAYNQQTAMNQYGLGRNLSDLATDIYGGNYQQERQRQLTAAAGLPTFNQQQLAPSQQLFDIGAQQQALGQHGLDINYADWLQQQQWPLQQLDILGSTIGQAMGHAGTSTQTAPYTGGQYNPWSGVLAGGLGAGALYNQYAQGGGGG